MGMEGPKKRPHPQTHDEVRVVNNQIGTPTYCYDLVRLLVNMCETQKYGYYHATNEGGYISGMIFAWSFISSMVLPLRLFQLRQRNMD